MTKYVYQIQGVLEDKSGLMRGLRVVVCTVDHFDTVDVPVEILDTEIVKYIQFRSKLADVMNMNKLPVEVQNKIRAPLGRYLDHWVLENYHGRPLDRKNINT